MCGSKKRQHSGSFILKENTITNKYNVTELIMKYKGWGSGTSDLLEDQNHPEGFRFGKEGTQTMMESPFKKRRLESAKL
jgi:hypothetical protein